MDYIDIGLCSTMEGMGTNNQVDPAHGAPIGYTIIVVDCARIPQAISFLLWRQDFIFQIFNFLLLQLTAFLFGGGQYLWQGCHHNQLLSHRLFLRHLIRLYLPLFSFPVENIKRECHEYYCHFNLHHLRNYNSWMKWVDHQNFKKLQLLQLFGLYTFFYRVNTIGVRGHIILDVGGKFSSIPQKYLQKIVRELFWTVLHQVLTEENNLAKKQERQQYELSLIQRLV